MTESRPGGPARPFGADELDGVSGLRPDELLAESRVARQLEATAARGTVRPSPDFADRVMAAVAKEPAAAPVRAARIALRHGAFWAFLASLRDAWRVTVSPSFPMAMRAQALALVLVVAAVATGTGVAAAGAIGLLDGNRTSPSPAPTLETPGPSVRATEPPSESPTPAEPSTSPGPSPTTGESAEPTDSADPSEATETDEPADAASPTKRPSPTHPPSPTHAPSSSAWPTHDGGHGWPPSHAPEPTR